MRGERLRKCSKRDINMRTLTNDHILAEEVKYDSQFEIV
jgi:hypothetical protein